MENRFEAVAGLGGYNLNNADILPEHLRDNELFQREFWHIAKEILANSFVVSSGRQYAQLCDLAGIAAVAHEKGMIIDREVLDSPLAVEAVRSWKLPDAHTRKPQHTEGLTEGVYEFWWRMLGDAFHLYNGDPLELPDFLEVMERFEECGVPIGQTSSTNREELGGIQDAILDIRQAKGGGSNELAMRALQWHLWATLHWLSHKRPRTDGGDVHAVRWRDAMLEASATPEEERSLYHHFLAKQVDALDTLLAYTPEELQEQPHLQLTKGLYGRALALYNKKHPETPITALHKSEPEPTINAISETTRVLGGIGSRLAAFE